MKYVLSVLCLIIVGCIFAFVGIRTSDTSQNEQYLRIHIRANSNSQVDQEVKYLVRDAVVEALIPILSECETKDEAQKTVCASFSYIENVANEVLSQNGFSYKAKAKLSNEYFPTRTYDNLTLYDGFYDAVILELGNAEGNNWWCLVYPAFCFLKTKKSSNSVYISKIWEIINSVKQK